MDGAILGGRAANSLGVADDAENLVLFVGALALACEGLRAVGGKSPNDEAALIYLASRVHDAAEDLAADASGRDTRWMTSP